MQYPRHKLLLLAVIFEGLALVIAVALARFLNINLTPITENFFRDIMSGTAFVLPPIGLFLLSISKGADRVPFIGSLKRIVLNEIRVFFADSRLVDLIIISLMAGIGEEALFRGVLQQKFGLVTASVIFGLVHFISPAYVIVTVVMGLYIGAIYQITHSLLVPIQIHFLYDLAALLWLRYVITPAACSAEEYQ